MQYREDRYGNALSVLGFGCMRFQRKYGTIDLAEAEKEIMLAIENGVNYFDTAYIYPLPSARYLKRTVYARTFILPPNCPTT